jgi:hypothetical protein
MGVEVKTGGGWWNQSCQATFAVFQQEGLVSAWPLDIAKDTSQSCCRLLAVGRLVLQQLHYLLIGRLSLLPQLRIGFFQTRRHLIPPAIILVDDNVGAPSVVLLLVVLSPLNFLLFDLLVSGSSPSGFKLLGEGKLLAFAQLMLPDGEFQ